MLIAAGLSLFGLALVCWLLFALAARALPAVVGALAGLFAYRTGAGPLGGALVGSVAGAATIVVGQALFEAARSPALRSVVAMVHAAPAAVAGYHAANGLSAAGAAETPWREVFALSGGIACACVAWTRVSTPPGSRGT